MASAAPDKNEFPDIDWLHILLLILCMAFGLLAYIKSYVVSLYRDLTAKNRLLMATQREVSLMDPALRKVVTNQMNHTERLDALQPRVEALEATQQRVLAQEQALREATRLVHLLAMMLVHWGNMQMDAQGHPGANVDEGEQERHLDPEAEVWQPPPLWAPGQLEAMIRNGRQGQDGQGGQQEQSGQEGQDGEQQPG